MELVFPPIQYLLVIIAGLVIGAFAMGRTTAVFLLIAGWAFFMSRLPAEFDRPDRIVAAAILWTVFAASVFIGDWLTGRRMVK